MNKKDFSIQCQKLSQISNIIVLSKSNLPNKLNVPYLLWMVIVCDLVNLGNLFGKLNFDQM